MPDPEEQPKEGIDMHLVRFFVKIMRTVFIGFFWMMLNVFLGIYLGWGLPEVAPIGYLVGFYLFFAISLAAYLVFVYRTWKDRFQKKP
jgi:heme/copper-type cytochrome/quinol oxidase subunit 4